MTTNLTKKGLHSIYGGLQMLSESRLESMGALAEISIILSSSEVMERHQINDNYINDFLGALHFLLKDLDKESVFIVTNFINEQQGIISK